MKKLLISATALLLAVTVVPASAQDTLVSRGDVAKAAPTFEGLITAMTKTAATIDELTKKQTIAEGDLEVVDTKPLLEGKGEEMLKIQLDKNKDSIKQLQELLSKHPAVEARLKKESANPSINEIIAAEVLASGKVQIYYRKS
jgi:hypothetical protein